MLRNRQQKDTAKTLLATPRNTLRTLTDRQKMKHYYYAENEQQLGSFTVDELKTKRLKMSTLVWTEGMQDWTSANAIEDLTIDKRAAKYEFFFNFT